MRAKQSAHVLPTAAILAVLSGCASTRLDASWSDPQIAPASLRGARVMVACEAYDLVLKQVCQDQLVAEVSARGVTAVLAPSVALPAAGQAAGNEAYLEAARSAGVQAVIAHAVSLSEMNAGSGSGVSLGVGGIGIGGGGLRIGMGVSVPVGGSRPSTGYAISSRISEAASGRLLWTARASAPASSDLNGQIVDITKALFDAADKARLF